METDVSAITSEDFTVSVLFPYMYSNASAWYNGMENLRIVQPSVRLPVCISQMKLVLLEIVIAMKYSLLSYAKLDYIKHGSESLLDFPQNRMYLLQHIKKKIWIAVTCRIYELQITSLSLCWPVNIFSKISKNNYTSK